jgi:hypothetical protein
LISGPTRVTGLPRRLTAFGLASGIG